MKYFSSEYVKFFQELSGNNHKDWFDLNRVRYENAVKQPFMRLVEDLTLEFQKMEPKFHQQPKSCILRINRDIRFSKNKSPYKLHSSAFWALGGKKSPFPGYYLEISATKIALAGGIWMPDKKLLREIRYEIANRLEIFQQITKNQEFILKTGGLVSLEKNKIIDKDLKEFAEIEPSILLKSYIFWKEFDIDLIESENLLKEITKVWQAAEPFYQFLKRGF